MGYFTQHQFLFGFSLFGLIVYTWGPIAQVRMREHRRRGEELRKYGTIWNPKKDKEDGKKETV